MCSDESEREIMAWDVYLQSQSEDHKAHRPRPQTQSVTGTGPQLTSHALLSQMGYCSQRRNKTGIFPCSRLSKVRLGLKIVIMTFIYPPLI